MAGTWDEIISNSRKKTNEQLAGDIAGLTKMTQADIDRIAPSSPDKEAFARLVKVIQDATMDNTAKAQAIKNTDQFVKMLIDVAKLLV